MTEPTHHTTYNGPVFNQRGEQVIGINYGIVGATQDPELRATVQELIARLRDLTAHLTPEQVRAVEETLPVLALDREAMTERGLVLARLGQIASSVGPMAQPVADALGRLLGLLG
ncbi:hypothetical protein YW3DRAFT_04676 [Streptomyces sp. MnatMP-M77]|uniref:hypothetical protein n=1 Tax=unclassified Streptomyces TaxID=2593676 RepID=UPI00080553A9|nr:hypothetical protein [Streptomyces sp. MnatMP-M77]MYT76515.1 hypothetical protein [Streptomyces sp. SID8364]SBV08662.1 hypothetical protein YW3DRAFT_04676 [Streptomyces sp. MnatMP-M77]